MKNHCKNCNQELSGNFCSNCGQKTSTERITFPYLLHEIPHSIFHLDKGFLFTLKELFTRPAKSITEFLEGKRAHHFKPLAYLIILSAVASFVAHVIQAHLAQFHYDGVILTANDLNRMIVKSSGFFQKYQSMFYFIMIPLISVLSWSFFHNKYNYWEHFIINTYLTAQFNILLIAAQIIRLFNDGRVSFTPILFIFFTYICSVYAIMFRNEEKRGRYLLKAITLYISIAFLYTTGLSLAGIMTPWWGI